jgi:hypothetical protein
MLQALRASGKTSDRKLRLFAAAWCRRVWDLLTESPSRRAVEIAEQVEDGGVGARERAAVRTSAMAVWSHRILATSIAAAVGCAGRFRGSALWTAASSAQWACAKKASQVARICQEKAACAWAYHAIAALTTAQPEGLDEWDAGRRGERFHQAAVLPDIFGPLAFRPVDVPSSVRTWNDGTVVRLAQAAYENPLRPEGTLDAVCLAVLADALEEAGCRDQEVLTHLRQLEGRHWRGCWVLDLLLVKQ